MQRSCVLLAFNTFSELSTTHTACVNLAFSTRVRKRVPIFFRLEQVITISKTHRCLFFFSNAAVYNHINPPDAIYYATNKTQQVFRCQNISAMPERLHEKNVVSCEATKCTRRLYTSEKTGQRTNVIMSKVSFVPCQHLLSFCFTALIKCIFCCSNKMLHEPVAVEAFVTSWNAGIYAVPDHLTLTMHK